MTLEMPNGSISKAYIPPRVPGGVGQYVPAVQMGARRLRETVKPGMYTPRPQGEDMLSQTFRDQEPMRRMMMERGQAAQMAAPAPRGTTPPGEDTLTVPLRPTNRIGNALGGLEQPMYFPPGRAAPAQRQGRSNVSLNIREDMPAGYGGIASRYGGRSDGVSTVVMPKDGAPGLDTARTLQHEMAHATPDRSSWRLHQVLNDPVKRGREEARADMAGGLNHVVDSPRSHQSAYYDGARSRTSAATYATSGMDRNFFRGYRQQHNAQAGNTIPQRLFGNPRNLADLGGGAGLGAWALATRPEEIGKSMTLEMPNGNVSKAIRSSEPKVRRGINSTALMQVSNDGVRVAAPDSLHAQRSGTSLVRRRPKYRVTAHPGEKAVAEVTSGDGDLYLRRKRVGTSRKNRRDLGQAIAANTGSYKGADLTVAKRGGTLSRVAKRGIIRPIRPPATGTAPSTPAPPKPVSGALRPQGQQGQRPRTPRMPQPPRPGGVAR